MTKQRLLSRGELWILIAVAVAIGAAALWTCYVRSLDVNPIVHIPPSPAMPVPNAYDFIRDANLMLRDRTKVEFANRNVRKANPRLPADRPYSLAEKSMLVSENAAVLETLRDGFQYPYQPPAIRSFREYFRVTLSQWLTALADLFVLDGQVKSARGDWDGAVSSDLDAITLGEIYPHSYPLQSVFEGYLCQSIGRVQIWKAIDHLNARQAKSAALRLSKIQAMHVPLWQAMQEQEWCCQAGLMETFREPDWRKSLGIALEFRYDTVAEGIRRSLRYTSKRALMSSYTAKMDAAVAYARLPYLTTAKEPGHSTTKNINGSVESVESSLIVLVYPVKEQKFDEAHLETENSLLMTMLALRAFRLEHGRYPATLSELTPRYLPSVPGDRFSIDQPLQYRRTAASYVLYSVGPDGKDDGGRAIVSGHSKLVVRHYVEEKSLGDIVAGVNK